MTRALVVIILILVIILALSIAFAAPKFTQPAMPDVCGDHEMQEKLRAVLHEALDEALKEHIKHTFEVWMRDDRDQPNRATTGVRQGVKAYIRSRNGVLQFSLKECPQ